MGPSPSLDPPGLRYWPARAFPAYRHVPGRTPHPRRHPAGHSHGRPEPTSGPLRPDDWDRHEAYLFGADLFNHGYWWEAHEQWEAPWRVTREAVTRGYLQGLVQLAAALVKWRAGNERGRQGLWRRSQAHLAAVAGGAPTYMGLDLAAQIEAVRLFFALYPARPDRDPAPGCQPPVLRLAV